jgi:mRNA-binding protein PUF3
MQTSYPQSRTIGQGAAFPRPQPQSGPDPASGTFKFSQKPTFGFDEKEKSGQFGSNTEPSFEIDSRPFRADQLGSQNAGFLAVGGSASRDGSMPPSRASDSGLSGSGLSFGNGNPTFGGSASHTPRSSINGHQQRASFSGLPGSRFMDISNSEAELRDKFASLGFSANGEPTNGSQSRHYSPGPTFTQTYQSQPNGSTMWNEAGSVKGQQHFDNHASHNFGEQSYMNKGHRFSEKGSISPAGSDHHRGLNSPKYYPSTATPPTGSAQLYRPGSRGPRAQPGPAEVDRRLQTVQYQYMYNAPFQGQFPPQPYEYVAPSFRQANVPYGYTAVPMAQYSQAQSIPTRPAKEQDVGVGVRSALLEDFRSNSKSTKRYDLKVSSYYT